jgi:histidinol phosphatase-like PHP family hydrolase
MSEYQYTAAGQKTRINLHTHTTWSDGSYTPEQLIRAGVVHHLTHLGITDHFYTRKVAAPQFYVDVDEVAEYAADLRALAEKYQNRIQVLVGIEVDWSLRAMGRFLDLLPLLYHLDYVLFEYVEDAEWAGNSLDSLLWVLPEVPIPAGLAHNDLARNFADTHTPEELVQTLEENRLFVELSTRQGAMGYMSEEPYNLALWQALAGSEVLFSIGSDIHRFIDDVGDVATGHEFLARRGILDRVITTRWNSDTRTWSRRT